MTDKFIIHGATYCGDGTGSAEATYNGETGKAWNNIGIFAGNAPSTYNGTGVVASGDTVYIRSKTGNGADGALTVTLGASATLGSSAATTSAWITWIIDGGTIWSGIDGTVIYECPSSYVVTFRSYNKFIAENAEKFVVKETNTSPGYKTIITLQSYVEIVNHLWDADLNGSTTGDYVLVGDACSVINLRMVWRRHADNLITIQDGYRSKFIGLNIELNATETASAVFKVGQYGSCLEVIGGSISGTGATTGAFVFSNNDYSNSGTSRFIGFKFPKEMTVYKTSSYPNGAWKLECTGVDAYAGAYILENWGEASTREDKYYPTRTTFIPDSVETPWSWWVYPRNASNQNKFLIPTGKLFTDAAAAKTITTQLLIANTVSSANKGSMWIEVSYIDDTTGNTKRISSRDLSSSALVSSSATWTARTYGDTGFTKYQIGVTTPTSIRQNSMVVVTLCGTWKSASASDVFIFCPDADLS